MDGNQSAPETDHMMIPGKSFIDNTVNNLDVLNIIEAFEGSFSYLNQEFKD